MTSSRKTRLYTLAAVAVAAIVAALLLFTGGDDQDAGASPFGSFARPPATVRAAAVERGPFVARAEYVGTLEAKATADLYARTSGPIVDITADIGDRVTQGQVLAVIESAEERERLEQSRASLRIAEATLEQRRSNLAIAETTAQRTQALFDQNLVSRQQADAVDAELAGARAQLSLAQAQVEQARAALSAAQVDVEQTRVVAPFDGVVGRRFLDLGGFAATNSPVMSVVDLSTIKTTVALPERDAAHVEIGQRATLTVGAYPGEEFPGRVARIGAVFDPDSGTARAEIEIDNPDGRLRPGTFGTITIALGDSQQALLVPEAAVLESEGRSYVFVLTEQVPGEGEASDLAPGLAARRVEVRPLGTASVRAAVDGPLETGQRVITLGHENLADGAPVVLAESGPGEPAAGGGDPEVTE